MKEVYLTREGYEKLRAELEYLKKVRVKELSKEMGEAKAHGDLSENAEYDAVKEAQEMCQKRISELENALFRVSIIDDMDIESDKVYIGATVKLKDMDSGEELTWIFVSGEEADPSCGKISISSPIGKGLVGHKEKDEVEIQAPGGLFKYKVLKISRLLSPSKKD